MEYGKTAAEKLSRLLSQVLCSVLIALLLSNYCRNFIDTMLPKSVYFLLREFYFKSPNK